MIYIHLSWPLSSPSAKKNDQSGNRRYKWARPVHRELHSRTDLSPVHHSLSECKYLALFFESLTNMYQANQGLTSKGWQVLQTDYNNASDLRFKLAGVDTVISTVSGNAQLNLIDAAAAAHVRRFAPSEFEGTPSVRPANDVLDNRRRAAIARLQQYESQGMRYTIFTCGIFYERFSPGGMAASQIGVRSNIAQEGEYIMDLRRAKAQLPFYNEAGQPVYVCMTSARDVARFVVAALSLASWPQEFRMRGDRMSVSDLVTIGEQLRGKSQSLEEHFERKS
jgi:hypothetical protein